MEDLLPDPGLYNVPWTTGSFNGMPYRKLGKTGLRVSDVGLGTWKIGYPETGDGSRVDEKTAFTLFDRAVDLGVTFWDTANRYNNASGNSERIIGKWMKDNPKQRRNVVIATKLFGGMDGVTPNHCGLSRGNIYDSVYSSLKRLQIDYIDLLYFHAYDSDTPVEESLEAVEDLVRQDLIRYFAVSNFTVDNLKYYQEIEKNYGNRCIISAVQNQFDILNGEAFSYEGVFAHAAENNISFIAWSPLARGLLTERYLDISGAGKGDRLYDEGTLEKDTGKDVMKKLARLADIANNYDMKVNELTIAYMLSMPGMGPVIPGASSIQQLESLARGGKIEITEEQKAMVKKVLHSGEE